MENYKKKDNRPELSKIMETKIDNYIDNIKIIENNIKINETMSREKKTKKNGYKNY